MLSLSGSDTLAHYQQVLDSVSYSSSSQNPTNSGADPSRTISWGVNDGTLNSATQTTTVNLNGGGTTLTVGQGKQFATIAAAVAAAHSGDTIFLDAGTYTNDFPGTINKNLTLIGVDSMVHMVVTTAPPNGKGILDVGGSGVSVTIENFEFSGAAVADGNGAGIRYEGGNLTLTGDYFHDNQDGPLAASDPNGSITIFSSEFANNGAGDGQTHNLMSVKSGR